MTFLILKYPLFFSGGGGGGGIRDVRGPGNGGVRCKVLKMRDVISQALCFVVPALIEIQPNWG